MDVVTSSLFSPGSPAGRAYLDQVLELPKLGLLAIADAEQPGDEGRAGVRIALEAIRTSIDRQADVLDRYRRHPTDELRERVLDVLQEAMARAAQEVFAYAHRREEEVRVAVDVLLLLEHEAFVAHVGDGRVYLVRRGLVHQVTVDHVGAPDEVFVLDAPAPEKAEPLRVGRAIARALGPEPAVRVETLCMELVDNDRFVLVSWSAHHHLPEGVLHHHLLADPLVDIGPGLARTAPDVPIVGVAGQLGGGAPDMLDSGRSRLAILAPMPLFAHCTERELRAVASATHPRRFAGGSVLFRQGDPGTELYLVISGRIRVERDGESIATLGPGSNFGEMAMLDEPRRSATTVAVEDCEVMVISREAFFALLKGNPLLAVKILWNMLLRLSAHLRTTTEALAEARAGADQDGPVLTGPLLSEPGRRVDTFPHRSAAPAPLRTEAPAPPREVADRGDVDLLGDDDASLVGDEESSFHGEFVLGDEEPS